MVKYRMRLAMLLRYAMFWIMRRCNPHIAPFSGSRLGIRDVPSETCVCRSVSFRIPVDSFETKHHETPSTPPPAQIFADKLRAADSPGSRATSCNLRIGHSHVSPRGTERRTEAASAGPQDVPTRSVRLKLFGARSAARLL